MSGPCAYVVMKFLEAREPISTVYEPREDSFLLLEALTDLDLRGARVLDMGTGSGILAAYCALRGAEVTASDIDSEAIQALNALSGRLGMRLNLVICDLFAEIKDQFDLIVFNPPYLPSDRIEDSTIDGGEQGITLIKRFLDELDQHLTEEGYSMILASSLNEPEELARRYPNIDFRVVGERRQFYETLYVIRAKTNGGN